MGAVTEHGKLIKYYPGTGEQCAVLPGDITSVGDRAFARTELAEVVLPESVTGIGMSAFEDCAALRTVTLPASLSYIGREAFAGCRSLSRIVIPPGVRRLSDGCFRGCVSLSEAVLHEELMFGSGVFSGCVSMKRLRVGSVTVSTPALGRETENIERLVRAVRYRTVPDLRRYNSPAVVSQLMAELYLLCGDSRAKDYLRSGAVRVFGQLMESGRRDLLVRLAADSDIVSGDIEALISQAITGEQHEVYIMLTGLRHGSLRAAENSDRFAL